mmetsp:Transcript_39885/g.94756  ORF Transcript_39885/g.94756 Transcript_39885/m.94756 type:complete len:251 (-) Transcript_39885:908-1660(-)
MALFGRGFQLRHIALPVPFRQLLVFPQEVLHLGAAVLEHLLRAPPVLLELIQLAHELSVLLLQRLPGRVRRSQAVLERLVALHHPIVLRLLLLHHRGTDLDLANHFIHHLLKPPPFGTLLPAVVILLLVLAVELGEGQVRAERGGGRRRRDARPRRHGSGCGMAKVDLALDWLPGVGGAHDVLKPLLQLPVLLLDCLADLLLLRESRVLCSHCGGGLLHHLIDDALQLGDAVLRSIRGLAAQLRKLLACL